MIFNNSYFDKAKYWFLILLAVITLTVWDCAKSSPKTSNALTVISGYATGSSYGIKLFLPVGTKLTQKELEARIRNRLREIEYMMSVFINDSEISRFNRYQGTGWFSVSGETAYVADESLKVSRLSGGAFDITIAPLLNIWGFGITVPVNSLPVPALIAKMKKITGFNNLGVRLSPPALSKKMPGLCCSFSAVAQGYAVDDIALLLDKTGISSYMVEIGGEIKAKGRKPDDSLWRIGVAAPEKDQKKIQLALPLDNTAVSTSGDYQNYFEKNGRRYSHTIDPKTGYPITHSLASVTVIHPSCMHADAMATAIDVLGPDKGYDLALKEKLPVYLIIHDSGKFKEKMTPEFEAIINK